MRSIKKVRAWIKKVMPYLAWASFTLALVGGSLLPATDLGRGIAHFVSTITWTWLPPVFFVGSVMGLLFDILRDLIPNRIAVYAASTAPTVASAIHGYAATWVTDFADWVASWTTGYLTKVSGIDTANGVAVLALVLAAVIAGKVTKPGRKGRGGGFDTVEVD